MIRENHLVREISLYFDEATRYKQREQGVVTRSRRYSGLRSARCSQRSGQERPSTVDREMGKHDAKGHRGSICSQSQRPIHEIQFFMVIHNGRSPSDTEGESCASFIHIRVQHRQEGPRQADGGLEGPRRVLGWSGFKSNSLWELTWDSARAIMTGRTRSTPTSTTTYKTIKAWWFTRSCDDEHPVLTFSIRADVTSLVFM